ncbi:MAG: hypothetical protein WC175_01075 [Candidatus Dojkabacteria bacterium]
MAATSGANAGLSFLDSIRRAKEIKAHNKRIDKAIKANKQQEGRIAIDARASQDWAANQLMKHRNNPNAIHAVENMYANKISSAVDGITKLRGQNAQLRMSKGRPESVGSSLIGSLGIGANTFMSMSSLMSKKDEENQSILNILKKLGIEGGTDV